jgi:hypothetical protein
VEKKYKPGLKEQLSKLKQAGAPNTFKWKPLPVEIPPPVIRTERRIPDNQKGRRIKVIGPVFNDPSEG